MFFGLKKYKTTKVSNALKDNNKNSKVQTGQLRPWSFILFRTRELKILPCKKLALKK